MARPYNLPIRPPQAATIRIAWSDDEYDYISSAYRWQELKRIVETTKTRITILWTADTTTTKM